MIYEATNILATNTDVLSVGRLNAIPRSGELILRFLADLATAAAQYTLTIQEPDGNVPVDAQLVRASSSGADGVMDDREVLEFRFAASQGGHFVVSLTETGTAVCMFEAILRW